MSSERDKAPQYRQHAKACLELAERMSPASERTRILEMAQHWLELATRAEISRPQCPKCQIEMHFFNVQVNTSHTKRPAMCVYECLACGRLTAEAA